MVAALAYGSLSGAQPLHKGQMKNLFLVFKNELVTTLERRSFLFAVFGLPLIAFIFVGFMALLPSNASRQVTEPGESLGTSIDQGIPATPEGFVDLSGLIKTIPATVPSGALRAYPDEVAAKQALATGEIGAYYLIAADYLSTGAIVYVLKEFKPLFSQNQSRFIQWVLQVNLLGGDAHLADQFNTPLRLEVTLLGEKPRDDSYQLLAFFLPFTVTLFFYITILMTSSLLLGSLTKDKETRVLEIILTSITPGQLLSGKILALGLAGLIQTAVWIGSAYVLLNLRGIRVRIPGEYQLPPSFYIWGIIFFVLGYALYASLMASIGTLAKNMREASQMSIILLIPMLVPLILITAILRSPDSPLAIGLSLFPFTSPVTIMTRLAITELPPWQIILAIFLLLGTTFIILRAIARIFRTQTLISGSPFKFKQVFAAMFER